MEAFMNTHYAQIDMTDSSIEMIIVFIDNPMGYGFQYYIP